MPHDYLTDHCDLSNSSAGTYMHHSPGSSHSSPIHPAKSISPLNNTLPDALSTLTLAKEYNHCSSSMFSSNQQSYNESSFYPQNLMQTTDPNTTQYPNSYLGSTTYSFPMMNYENASFPGNSYNNTQGQNVYATPSQFNTFQPVYLEPRQINPMQQFTAKLEIREPPVEKFRFRYKSEMHGTHGSLNGANSKRSPKTFPEVELVNFKGNAIIRCSLFQVDIESPHSHQLVVRKDDDDINDPHDVEVGPEIGYIGQFQNMGIIHTAKKNIKEELFKKKKERLRFKLGIDCVSQKMLHELEAETEREAKTMNLNQVRLCFEAFKREANNTYTPIAAPVFSKTINNRKSAQTGELRIVRISIATGKATGGDEMILLVEKVSKKNIKVRFYELDDDNDVIWEGYAKFNESDVHHQYAIICQTPPYKNPNIEEPVKVYIELVRPSDDERSVKMTEQFTYKPVHSNNNRKRRRMYSSATTSSSGTDNIPLTVTNPNGSLPSLTQIVGNEEFSNIANLESNELMKLCISGNLQRDGIVSSESISLSKNLNTKNSSEISRYIYLISSLFDKKDPVGKKDSLKNVVDLYESYAKNNSENETIVHDLIISDDLEVAVGFLKNLQDHKLSYLLNEILNANNESPLHCACSNNRANFIKPLLEAGCNPNIQDKNGNTALHVAVREGFTKCLEVLLKARIQEDDSRKKSDLTIKNDEGFTALHLAIKLEKSDMIKMLLEADGEASRKRCSKDGNNALHLAVLQNNPDLIVDIINYSTNLDFVTDVNNAGLTPLQLAKTSSNKSSKSQMRIIEILTPFQDKVSSSSSLQSSGTIKEEELSSSEEDLSYRNEENEFIKTEDQAIKTEDEEIKFENDEPSDLSMKKRGDKMETSTSQIEDNFKACLNDMQKFMKLCGKLNQGNRWKDIISKFSEDSYLCCLCQNAEELLIHVREKFKGDNFLKYAKALEIFVQEVMQEK